MSSLSSNGQPSTRSRQANSGDRTTAQLRDIRQKQLSHVLYWRFFVNLALMLIDAAMYIIAGATVLNLRHEATPLYSSRFNFTIDSTVYLIIVACFWVWSLYVAGILLPIKNRFLSIENRSSFNYNPQPYTPLCRYIRGNYVNR